ncbi:glycosyltransferase [Streptomyces sp. NPDC101219]|uniref:glycosyltransferase n=1 Tax=Streptomyces sp. NPDC101219 TaxID=3366131 RepID=UPI0037FA4B18
MGRTVLMFAGGSRGDVQPFLSLGRLLAGRGDTVRLLASTRYRDLVTAAGMDFRPLAADPAGIVASAEGQELLAGQGNPVSFIRGMRRVLRPRLQQVLEQTRAAGEGCDVVLAPSFGFLGVHLSQYLRIPHVVVHFQPSQPTGGFPHPFTPGARFLGPLGNRLSYHLVDAGTWLAVGGCVNAWRRESLGLPALPARAVLAAARRAPVLCAFSPAVVPPPADWGPRVHVTGFWHYEQPWFEPPPRLRSFLQDGPAPVYVGFGSMSSARCEATDQLVRTALRRARLRGVLAGDPATSEDDMLVVDDVPHDWLFPRMAAVVHHGGAGTTASALRAGVPSLVCPFFGDQIFWAGRVHRLGAGPAPLPAAQLTVAGLTARLTALTASSGTAQTARRLGAVLRAENGAARACRLLDEVTG